MFNYRSLNSVTIVGRIGSTKVISSDKSKFLALSVATESSRKTAEGKYENATEWHDIIYFGGNAEKMAPALTKGTYVVITGSLSTRKTDKGRFTSIIADQLQILGTGGATKEQKSTSTQKEASKVAEEEEEDPMF